MGLLDKLKRTAKKLKLQICILYFAARHPGTPWYAKLVVAAVVAYALSPIDLIPDFIPLLGYIDDLIILPMGIWLALKLIPDDVLKECVDKAARVVPPTGKNWQVVVVVVIIWLCVLVVLGKWLWAMM